MKKWIILFALFVLPILVEAQTYSVNVGDFSSLSRISGGTGDPESVVSGNPGDVFLRTDGGVGTGLYIKETGTGNTGWAAYVAGSSTGVDATGTPVNNQLAVWTDANTIEGDVNLTWDGTTFFATNLGSATNEISNAWIADSGGVFFGDDQDAKIEGTGIDGELDFVDNAETTNAGVRIRRIVEAVTATKTPSALESFEVYTNEGDTDGTTFTMLNDPSSGLQNTYLAVVAQTMTLQEGAGETLNDSSGVCTDIRLSLGQSVTLIVGVAGAGGSWWVIASEGAYTCTP